jgi:DDE superfamily endonuclease
MLRETERLFSLQRRIAFMAVNTSKITKKSLRQVESFVGDFKDAFKRLEQRKACITYLYQLISSKSRTARSVAAKSGSPQTMRHFIRASPWSADTVGQRLQDILSKRIQGDGMLAILQIDLPKQGYASVGAIPRLRQYNSTHMFPRPRTYHQRVISIWWVVNEQALPLAVKPFCPNAWFELFDRETPRVQRVEKEMVRDRSDVVINLLTPLLAAERWQNCPVIIDGDFDNEWPLIEYLNHQGRDFAVNIRDDHQWPLNSIVRWAGFKGVDLTAFKKYEFTKRLPRKGVPKLSADKSLGNRMDCLDHIVKANNRWAARIGYKKFHSQNVATDRGIELYLANTRNTPLDEFARCLKLGRLARNAMLETRTFRRFEGRSLVGLHRHFTLCILASLFSSNHLTTAGSAKARSPKSRIAPAQ